MDTIEVSYRDEQACIECSGEGSTTDGDRDYECHQCEGNGVQDGGWYWRYADAGIDSEPCGPYPSEVDAFEDARR